MSYLTVRDLELSYGPHRILKGVSFSVQAKERLCLLGPSGCGKTTTLHIIAGFVQADAGRVEIAGRSVDGLPPEKRNIGIMFQNYALFPHLNVFENVAFGLKMRGMRRDEIQDRVAEALRLVRLPNAGPKTTKQLSGGEQQRIAFARAVVIKPSLLLLDEPFSNLDARLRLEMRAELLDLLQTLDVATVMVTHDQEEAMAIAHRIAVMRAGVIEQIGTTKDIYEDPANLFVGQFVGESNVLDAAVRDAGPDGISAEAGGLGVLRARPRPGVRAPEPVRLLIRPERILVSEDALPAGEAGWNTARATVEQVLFLGHRTEWRVRSGSHRFTIWQHQPPGRTIAADEAVTIRWRPEDTFVVPKEPAHVGR